MNVDLRGNIKSVGRVYVTVVKNPRGWALVRQTVVCETDPPFRGGSGWGLMLWPFRIVLTVGLWQDALVPAGTMPWDVEAFGEIDEDVADTAEIKEWTRGQHPLARWFQRFRQAARPARRVRRAVQAAPAHVHADA